MEPTGNVEDSFDRCGVGRIGVGEPAPHGATCDRQWSSRELQCIADVDRTGEFDEKVFVVGDQSGFAGYECRNITSRDVVHQGNEFIANTVTSETWIIIGRIIDRGDAERTAQLVGFGAANCKQGFVVRPTHSAQTIDRSSAHQVEQDGFGLIVCCVTGEDAWRQGGKSRCSCPCLEVRTIGHFDTEGHEPDVELVTQLGDDVCFIGRTATEPMIDVIGGDVEAGFHG